MDKKIQKIPLFRGFILIILFLSILFLFSQPSVASIPGDFNGDGCVQFEDLMIFALAYGSTPDDDNWNVACDIATTGGVLEPDGVINFEDLMIFALHYGEHEESTWTIMFYMDADNNLEPYMWQELEVLESIGSTADINIIVQMDPYDDCDGTFRYYVTGAEQGISYPLYPADIVQTLPEQNMADQAVLTNFINWSSDYYPAEHYMLVLRDHGAGWREDDEIFKGIIWDDTTGDWEHIDLLELSQSLENSNIEIDVLYFGACLMQMVESFWEMSSNMSKLPNYVIGSENSTWSSHHAPAYEELFTKLTSNPDMNQQLMCEVLVNSYIDSFTTTTPATMSAFQFSSEFINNTPIIINNFSNALMNSSYQEAISTARSLAQSYELWDRPQYKDLYHFAQIIKDSVPDCQTEAQAVMDFINNVIVIEAHSGIGVENSHGLSTYLIDSPAEYDSSYDMLQFVTDTQWDEFLLSGEGIVTGVMAIPITSQVSTDSIPEAMSSIDESSPFMDYHIADFENTLKGETVNRVFVRWDAYYEVDGYRVYKSVNGEEFDLFFEWADPPIGSSGYAFYDPYISEGNTYAYYVKAYGDGWETQPSQKTVTIEITAYTFLPPCSLVSPTDNSIVTDLNPVFTWNPVGLDDPDLPYGEICFGETYFRVYNANTSETTWSIWFNDMTTSSVTYNQDGLADLLVPGNIYRWYVRTYGYDLDGNLIAISQSEDWCFDYDL